MALLLNIDTAAGEASICVAENGHSLGFLSNPVQMDHASWLHTAIRQVLQSAGRTLDQLEGIAVTAGPGSYTGLRVGLASAKGLCYALNIPLITINTLEVMAYAAKQFLAGDGPETTNAPAGRNGNARSVPITDRIDTDVPGPLQTAIGGSVSITEPAEAGKGTATGLPVIPSFLCPLIDARRMEVFTAVYDLPLNLLMEPDAVILEPGSFQEYLEKGKVLFFGNGSEKWEKMGFHPNAVFAFVPFSALTLSLLAEQYFRNGRFAGLAYSEPFYIKDFYIHPKVNG